MNHKARLQLIELLQLAYSGERAAALAYRYHHRSLKNPAEKSRVREIEQEEWNHRDQLRIMLQLLCAKPRASREFRAWLIGTCLGFLCRLVGWFLPMYGAGRLERKNVQEYVDAARYAREAGYPQWIETFLHMAEVEWEHEQYFRSRIEGHYLTRTLPLWDPPPPKDSLSNCFNRSDA